MVLLTMSRKASDTSADPLMTRETVAVETPATRATSFMVGRGLPASCNRLLTGPARVEALHGSNIDPRGRQGKAEGKVCLRYDEEYIAKVWCNLVFGSCLPEASVCRMPILAESPWRAEGGHVYQLSWTTSAIADRGSENSCLVLSGGDMVGSI